MVRATVWAVVAGLLGGCATGPLLTAEQRDDQKCQSYGFRSGGQAYAQCRMTLDLNRQERRRNALQLFGNAMERAGASMQTPPMTMCNTYWSDIGGIGGATTYCH
jgi:hypothetical protein